MVYKESLRKGVKKIETMMKQESLYELTFERKNLPEIFSDVLLELHISHDELPALKQTTLEYFKSKGIMPIYYNNSIRFFKILDAIPEAKVVFIVSKDGFPIGSAYQNRLEETKRAAMTAALFTLAKGAIKDMENGEFEQLYVKGKDGYLLVMEAGPNAVLAVSTESNIKLRILFLHCKQICEKIAQII
jgi:predicted regulator of Ras-like GTPase activity (Roadblock/LC7/MglB family)